MSEKHREITEFSKSNDLNQVNGIFDFDDATINVFDESPKVDTPLDANKCTFGPKYWCSSRRAMEECNVSVMQQ